MAVVIRKNVGTVADPIVPELVPGIPEGYTVEEFRAKVKRDVINFARALARDHARAEHKRSNGG